MSAGLQRLIGARWPEILKKLGVSEGALSGRHAPCPICGGTDRFRFDNLEGRGTWICNQCGAGDGIGLVRGILSVDFPSALKAIEDSLHSLRPPCGAISFNRESLPIRPKPAKDNRETAVWLWEQCAPIDIANPAGRYLRRRGILLSPLAGLRYLSKAAYFDGKERTYHPALVAAIQTVDGKIANLHRTYLDTTGGKAAVGEAKKYLSGSIPPGSAVRLGRHGNKLAIAEGIESALSVQILFEVPCWAATSARGIGAWQPPAEVTEVTIVADNDESGVGAIAAKSLASRLAAEGIRVVTLQPRLLGADANDVLLARERSWWGNPEDQFIAI